MFKSMMLAALGAWPLITIAQPAPQSRSPEYVTWSEFSAYQQQTDHQLTQINSQLVQINSLLQQLQQQSNARQPITSEQTIEVPSQHLPVNPIIAQGCKAHHLQQLQTIQDALTCLEDVTISPAGLVTIELTQAPTAEYQTIRIDHPNAKRLQIIGNCPEQSGSSRCRIQFAPGQPGLVIENQPGLAQLSNFSFIGHDELNGIDILNHASLPNVNQMNIEHFDLGIHTGKVSQLSVTNSQLHHNRTGLYIGGSSYVLAYQLLVTENSEDGLVALYNSSIQLVDNSQCHDNGRYNLRVRGAAGIISGSPIPAPHSVGSHSYYFSFTQQATNSQDKLGNNSQYRPKIGSNVSQFIDQTGS